MAIGERLREKRQSMKLTAKELSERSGVPEKTIYRIEKDKNADPKISSIVPLIEALECSADNLIMDSKYETLSGILRFQFERSNKLPIKEKAQLIQIIDRWVNSVNTEKLYLETLSLSEKEVEVMGKKIDDDALEEAIKNEYAEEMYLKYEEQYKK